MKSLDLLVTRAQAGDLEAYRRLVESTHRMAFAVAYSVLRDDGLAEDATQDAYLRAFRHLADLESPGAFASWLRRTVITVSLNLRRSRRRTFLQLEDVPDVPVLDETETRWSDSQRQRLASALLSLSAEERRLCDRRYHGGWTTVRLAREAGVGEAVMRKRLQRVREKLRKEIEMSEQRNVAPEDMHPGLPARIVELLARPRLSDLPENPVGSILNDLRPLYTDCTEILLPEIIDFADARKSVGDDALYIEQMELQRVDERRILRYDLTLPLFMTLRYDDRPVHCWSAGKAYRRCAIDTTHLEAFHQLEIFHLEARRTLDPWRMTARILEAIEQILPGRTLKIVPTAYTMCTQAWELEIEDEGQWFEVLAWGVFTDRVVRHLGADPTVHTAIGVGCGLERLAMLRFGIDDIRKVEATRVA